MDEIKNKTPWSWIPTIYFAEGLPWTIVMLVSVVFFKRMGISNVDIALYTSWLYLPWVIKPFWAPLVDILRTKRLWIISMQVLIGAALGGIALSVPLPGFFKWSLGFLWLLAFSSATHDIAVDGFYMLGLNQKQQTWFIGIRSTFYRFSIVFGQGLLIILAGYLESGGGAGSVDMAVKAKIPDKIESYSYFDIPPASEPEITKAPAVKVFPGNIVIPIQHPEPGQVKNLLKIANDWNQDRSTKIPDLPAIRMLEKVDQPAFDFGNVGLVFVSLTAPPKTNEEITVLFGRKRGDKSISLLTDGRMTFNSKNWNKPYIQVINLDKSLRTSTETVFESRAVNLVRAWAIIFGLLSVMFVFFFIYHLFILPRPLDDKPLENQSAKVVLTEFVSVFRSFFNKPGIIISLLFILLYRFGEAQLVKIAPLFMLDRFEAGGLSLTTGTYGFIYGTLGFFFLTAGGILGGILASRKGLIAWIIPMALAMKLPDLVYVYMAFTQPDNTILIAICVAIEQFGYGFGFTAFMLFLIQLSEGDHKTAHYAIATGFMALGMMLPGMFSGWLQELLGYRGFFIWVMICTIPGLLLIKYLKIDPEFGKNEN